MYLVKYFASKLKQFCFNVFRSGLTSSVSPKPLRLMLTSPSSLGELFHHFFLLLGKILSQYDILGHEVTDFACDPFLQINSPSGLHEESYEARVSVKNSYKRYI